MDYPRAEAANAQRTPWRNSAHVFFRRPWREKLFSIRFRCKRLWHGLFPSLPLPVRLPYGGWWLARNDVCGDAVFTGNFEETERRFVERCLREGMTVLDIGAHHGFYTMLAARKVGPKGRVLAFEPSSRERGGLLRHLWLNRLRANVVVHPLALGREEGTASLFVVEGKDTGCNSLRPPAVGEPTKTEWVQRSSLDSVLNAANIRAVDFMKLDAEGAELEVLEGAAELLRRSPRPIVLAEVDDGRTAPWGYPAFAIYDFLAERGYEWFSIGLDDTLQPCPRAERFHANLVSVPVERLSEIRMFFPVERGAVCIST